MNSTDKPKEKRFTHLFPVQTFIGNKRNLTAEQSLEIVDNLMTSQGVVIDPKVHTELEHWLEMAEPGNIFTISFHYKDNDQTNFSMSANELLVYER